MAEQHVSDSDLERLILRVEAGEDTPPDPHMSACTRCTGRYRFLRQFYEQYRNVLRAGDPPRIAAMAETLADPHRLILPPFSARPGPATTAPRKSLLLHAALTGTETRFASVATFALASTGVLARVVRDQESGLYRISVLSEDPEHRRYVLVGVGGPEGQSPLNPTDRDGLATMHLEYAADWNTMFVVVITPCASITLPQGLPLSGSLSGGAVTASIAADPGSVRLTLVPAPGERIGHAVAVLRDGSAVLREVADNRVSFDPSVAPVATELRFFL
jgi:hypothetical protein